MPSVHHYVTQQQEVIREALEKNMPSFGPKTPLRESIEYVLFNGGRRIRSILVFLIAGVLHKGCDVTDAALAIEYFHNASLIADDLPCMEKAVLRRGQPTVHVVYGESIALLATYSLIAAGYERICLNARALDKTAVLALAIENVAYNTGILGAAGGQYQSLFPTTLNEETLLDIMNKKTVACFEMACVLGWLFGGGNLNKLDKLKQAARHFGRAFQISDNFLDRHGEVEKPNFITLVGETRAAEVLSQELNELRQLLDELHISSPEMLAFISLTEHRFAHTMTSSSS